MGRNVKTVVHSYHVYVWNFPATFKSKILPICIKNYYSIASKVQSIIGCVCVNEKTKANQRFEIDSRICFDSFFEFNSF